MNASPKSTVTWAIYLGNKMIAEGSADSRGACTQPALEAAHAAHGRDGAPPNRRLARDLRARPRMRHRGAVHKPALDTVSIKCYISHRHSFGPVDRFSGGICRAFSLVSLAPGCRRYAALPLSLLQHISTPIQYGPPDTSTWAARKFPAIA